MTQAPTLTWCTGRVLAGSMLLVMLLGHGIPDRGTHFGWSLGWTLTSALLWLLVVREVLSGRYAPRVFEAAVWVVSTVAIAVSLGPAMSDDIHRYVFEGRMLVHGYHPYLHAPADPAVAHLRDGSWELINNKQISAAYPPAVQWASAIGSWFQNWVPSPDGVGVRAVFGACHIAAFLALWGLLRVLEVAPARALIYGTCPLLAIEFAAEGHSDSVAIWGIVLACFACRRVRPVWTGVALGIAIAGKLIPVVLLPFLWRELPRPLRGRFLAALGVTMAVFWGPFLATGGLAMFDGTLQYVTRWRGNESMFAAVYAVTEWIHGLGLLGGVEVQRASKVPIALLGVFVLWLAWRRRVSVERAGLWFFLYFIAFAPTVHPWYVGFVVPFLCIWPQPLVLAFVGGTVFLAYHVLPEWLVYRRWDEQGFVRVAEYAPLYLGLLLAYFGVGESGSLSVRKKIHSARRSSASR